MKGKAVLGLVLVSIVIITGCTNNNPNLDRNISNIKNSPRFALFPYLEGKIISEENGLINITLLFHQETSIPIINSSAEIVLPEGIKLIDGILQWEGFLAHNETKSYDILIQIPENGNYVILGYLREHSSIDNSFVSERNMLFIDIVNDKINITKAYERPNDGLFANITKIYD